MLKRLLLVCLGLSLFLAPLSLWAETSYDLGLRFGLGVAAGSEDRFESVFDESWLELGMERYVGDPSYGLPWD